MQSINLDFEISLPFQEQDPLLGDSNMIFGLVLRLVPNYREFLCFGPFSFVPLCGQRIQTLSYCLMHVCSSRNCKICLSVLQRGVENQRIKCQISIVSVMWLVYLAARKKNIKRFNDGQFVFIDSKLTHQSNGNFFILCLWKVTFEALWLRLAAYKWWICTLISVLLWQRCEVTGEACIHNKKLRL